MAVAIPYIMVAMAAVSTAAAIRQGNAASDAANYNKQLEQQNAAAAQQQAAQAQAQQQREMGLKLGSLAANTGASGVDSSTGSPLDVLSDSIQQGTLDNLNIKYNYQLKALGYSNSAGLDSSEANNATTSGYLNAAGSALGGASQVAKYYAGQSGGVPVTGN